VVVVSSAALMLTLLLAVRLISYSKHKKIKISLADVLGNIVKNPLILKKESDGKVLLLAVRLISPSVALKLTPVRVMLPCTWLVGLLFAMNLMAQNDRICGSQTLASIPPPPWLCIIVVVFQVVLY
jgi:hypothetical protein